MPPDDPPDDPDRGAVLSPDELDITADDRVAEIDDGRFVIAAGDDAPDVDDVGTADDVAHGPAEPGSGEPVDERAVRDWLLDSLEDADAHYGFDVTVKVDDDVARQRLLSNDISVTFETLLTWYAQRVGRGTAVEVVLGILLNESNVPIRYPPETMRALVDEHDLGPDDSIADLLAAVDEADGVVLPD